MQSTDRQTEKKPIITVKSLRKMYHMGSERVVALEDVNLTIARGEICCILGTSGSGKSTLLNMLAGLERPTRGQVLIGKHDVSRMSESALATFRQKYVGFVFQSYNLLGMLTAAENVSMPLMFRGVDRAKRNKLARQMLKNVGLANRYDHKPTQMSGGQQQRVGIARAFVSRPRIVFADEPTGNLDSRTTVEVMELMVSMSRENDQTLILVTHNAEIADYADRVITLIDGRIVSDVYRVPGQATAETGAAEAELPQSVLPEAQDPAETEPAQGTYETEPAQAAPEAVQAAAATEPPRAAEKTEPEEPAYEAGTAQSNFSAPDDTTKENKPERAKNAEEKQE